MLSCSSPPTQSLLLIQQQTLPLVDLTVAPFAKSCAGHIELYPPVAGWLSVVHQWSIVLCSFSSIICCCLVEHHHHVIHHSLSICLSSGSPSYHAGMFYLPALPESAALCRLYQCHSIVDWSRREQARKFLTIVVVGISSFGTLLLHSAGFWQPD
jgi:hypothetical protein